MHSNHGKTSKHAKAVMSKAASRRKGPGVKNLASGAKRKAVSTMGMTAPIKDTDKGMG